MASNYQFSKHDPDHYVADPLFTQDKRHNALEINIPVHASHVRDVSDDPDQFDNAVDAAGADLLGGQYGYARAGYVRRALRPAARGDGRGRWR